MNGNVKTAALSLRKDSLNNTRHAPSRGARGRSWRRATVRCTTDVCGVTAIPSYVSNPNLRYAPLTDAADALSRRVTVLCTMNVCVDMAALNRAGLKHALSKGAAGSTMQRVTATCTTTVSGERAALSLAADWRLRIRKRAESFCSRPVLCVLFYAARSNTRFFRLAILSSRRRCAVVIPPQLP